MKIKLKGNLPERLQDYDLKPGDIFEADTVQVGRVTDVVIIVDFDEEPHNVTISRKNYIRV